MNRRADARAARTLAVVERMELTRAQLLASTLGPGSQPRAQRSENALTVPNIGRALMAAPNVTMLGSIVLASLIIGPRRVLPLVTRVGLTSWVARNVRTVVGRTH